MSKMKREYDWQGTGLARNWGDAILIYPTRPFFFFFFGALLHVGLDSGSSAGGYIIGLQ